MINLQTLAANLRSQVNYRAADFIESMVPLHDAWLVAAPPCPTCGGTKLVAKGEPNFIGLRWQRLCPDCRESPGVQPFDKWTAGLVALWTVVRDDRLWQTNSDAVGVVAYLRQIGGAA